MFHRVETSNAIFKTKNRQNSQNQTKSVYDLNNKFKEQCEDEETPPYW